jgi:peptidoglycan/xylan/chitin deacetylase (PgdA/CDA1 family)
MKKLISLFFLLICVSVGAFTSSEDKGVVYENPNATKLIALTFDDGPDLKMTPMLLDFLQEQGIKATFFLVGQNVKAYPQLVERINKEGHIISNHSYTHMNFKTHSMDAVKKELSDTDDAIEKIIGKRPAIFRPPYGSLSKAQKEELKKLGYTSVLWNIDTVDWKSNTSKAQIIQRVGSNPHSKDIVLMHTMPKTVKSLEALRELVPELKSKGYVFVTVDEILEVSPFFPDTQEKQGE